MKWIVAVVVLLMIVGSAVGVGFWRFHHQVQRETVALLSRNSQDHHTIIEENMLEGLPAPVQHWLQSAGVIGTEMVHTVHLQQQGLMRLRPDQEKWMEASSHQVFTVSNPGFLWKVNTSMAGIPVVGRDLFDQGQGAMEIRLAGLVPVVNVSHHERINEATLQRFLGEIVWFPSAALSPYIHWEPLDDQSAKATLTVDGTSGAAVFYFKESGEVSHFVAQRYRDIHDETPTEWLATVKNTTVMNGITIPNQLEIAWVVEGTPFTWYIFEIDQVVYNQET